MTATSTNVMANDIHDTPQLVRTIHRGLDLGTRRALDHDDLNAARRVILTGCGDSHFAGVATAGSFERLAGIPTAAVPSMEASRYLLPGQQDVRPRSPLVIGVSVSGEISRTVEALIRARSLGALACAVTGDASSRAGQAADRVIEVKLPPRSSSGHIPGTRSFTASLLTLYLTSFHMAEVRDRLSVTQVNELGARLLQDADRIGDVLEVCDPRLRTQAEVWADMSACVVLGTGPNLATAQFLAAKIIEATGVHATASDLEEWAHLHHFVRDVRQPVIVLAPHGSATTRAVELVELMRRRGRRILVVTTDESPLADDRDDVLVVADRLIELTSPFILHAGLSLLAAYLAQTLGVTYFADFPPDPDPNGNTIVRSKVVSDPEPLPDDVVPVL